MYLLLSHPVDCLWLRQKQKSEKCVPAVPELPSMLNLQLPEFRRVTSRACLPVWVPQLEKWQLIQGDIGVQLAKTKTLLVSLSLS